MNARQHAYAILAAASRLHDAGYSRLRIRCYVKEGLGAWRHCLFASDEFNESEGCATDLYSLPGDPIADGRNSRAIAAELVARYPRLMAAAKGPPGDYAAWLRHILLQHPGCVLEMEEPEHAMINGRRVEAPFVGKRPHQLLNLPCADSADQTLAMRRLRDVSRDDARARAESAMDAMARGWYLAPSGHRVEWRDAIERAKASKCSLPPNGPLPNCAAGRFTETIVQVRNETTLQAGRRLVGRGLRPLALNFANGKTPGGGFLHGARAQEESLCWASALYATLDGDPMYAFHAARPEPDSSDWMIVSPQVPVFRDDSGTALEEPWLLDFLTAAAPYAPMLGQPRSGDLLTRRIHRALAVAASHGYDTLILGAWGCGAFGNDPSRTARDFRAALEGKFGGCFREIVFAVVDWSPERRMLGPFRNAFSAP